MCGYVRACVGTCVRACMRACVGTCVRACVRGLIKLQKKLVARRNRLVLKRCDVLYRAEEQNTLYEVITGRWVWITHYVVYKCTGTGINPIVVPGSSVSVMGERL